MAMPKKGISKVVKITLPSKEDWRLIEELKMQGKVSSESALFRKLFCDEFRGGNDSYVEPTHN
ncbi:hypothetical protein D3C81_375400 [compost metagenome]